MMNHQCKYSAVIFDLDGVIISTDNYHYCAWKWLADKEGIPFDRTINERLRGVSRMESLEILLERAGKKYSDEAKLILTEEKNDYYRILLDELTPDAVLPGTYELLKQLKDLNIKIAIGSSSKNASNILKKIGMIDWFDAIADGNQISNSKPDPEVFLLAVKLLSTSPENSVVVEDATAGIDAAKAAGMRAVAVGYAAYYEKADYAAKKLADIDINQLLNC